MEDQDQRSLSEQQARLIAQQQAHLRTMGKSVDVDTLAVRARFISAQVEEDVLPEAMAQIKDARTLLPLDLCRRYNCVATGWREGVLTVQASGLLKPYQRELLMRACLLHTQSMAVKPCSREEVLKVLGELEQSGTSLGLIRVLQNEGLDAGRLRRLVYALLSEALDQRASDIHLIRKADPDAWVSFRVDSVLRPLHLLSETLMQSLVARIKIESGMDASNSRTAQDGRIGMTYHGRPVDFRVSSQPLVDGESIVLRALDASRIPSMQSLFPKQDGLIDQIRGLLGSGSKAGGIVLISGATGSGKSTTQYTMACGLARDEVNVVTVEDPVEYALPFAKQIQLQALINQRATELERSILRQDPDILIFGEIRDADSARAVLAFAESGHLVISTIHANGVLQVSERFMSMIHPQHRQDAQFLLGNYLKMTIHQRLVPSLCRCARPADEVAIAKAQVEAEAMTGGLLKVPSQIHQAVGCERCQGTGYMGRTAAHETLFVKQDPLSRTCFARAFQEGRIEVPADLHPENGIQFTSRLDTLATLLQAGVMDWPTVKRQLAGESKVASWA